MIPTSVKVGEAIGIQSKNQMHTMFKILAKVQSLQKKISDCILF